MFTSEMYSLQAALVPADDRYNTDPATDVYTLKEGEHICFWLEEGAGGTGTVKIQVEECSDVTGANNVAIAFRYRIRGATGTWGAVTASASAGYTTIAGANKGVVVELDAQELSPTKPCVRLKLTEVVNSPCGAAVYAAVGPMRYGEAGVLDPTA